MKMKSVKNQYQPCFELCIKLSKTLNSLDDLAVFSRSNQLTPNNTQSYYQLNYQQSLEQPMMPFGNNEESNSVGYRNPFPSINLEDSINFHYALSQTHKSFSALFAIGDNSFTFNNLLAQDDPSLNEELKIRSPMPKITQVVQPAETAQCKKRIQISISSPSKTVQHSDNADGKQRMIEIAVNVMKIVKQKRMTTTNDLTKDILKRTCRTEEYTKYNKKGAKRVKRRIYDTLGVLTACERVTKQDGKILRGKINDHGGSASNKYDQLYVEKLQNNLKNLQNRIQEKAQIYEQRVRQLLVLQKLQKRNKELQESGKYIPKITSLPFLLIAGTEDSDMRFDQPQNNLVQVNCSPDVTLYGDLDVLKLVFPDQEKPQIIEIQ